MLRFFTMCLSFFSNTSTRPDFYTLSLHDALPIYLHAPRDDVVEAGRESGGAHLEVTADRKSTRLNSSHEWTSYAVFCLKKKRARAWSTRSFMKAFTFGLCTAT